MDLARSGVHARHLARTRDRERGACCSSDRRPDSAMDVQMSELETEVLEDSCNRDPKSASDTKALMEASKTQIEQLKHMLHNFEHKVRRIEQVALSTRKMKEWEKLLADTRSGAIDFEQGEKKMLELMNGFRGTAIDNLDDRVSKLDAKLVEKQTWGGCVATFLHAGFDFNAFDL